MPRRRRVPKQRIGGITPAQKRWFLNPFAQLDGPVESGLFKNEAHARALWLSHGEQWTAEYESLHRGERPPAWNRYGAPKHFADSPT